LICSLRGVDLHLKLSVEPRQDVLPKSSIPRTCEYLGAMQRHHGNIVNQQFPSEPGHLSMVSGSIWKRGLAQRHVIGKFRLTPISGMMSVHGITSWSYYPSLCDPILSSPPHISRPSSPNQVFKTIQSNQIKSNPRLAGDEERDIVRVFDFGFFTVTLNKLCYDSSP
jgi:hypothetical protein